MRVNLGRLVLGCQTKQPWLRWVRRCVGTPPQRDGLERSTRRFDRWQVDRDRPRVRAARCARRRPCRARRHADPNARRGVDRARDAPLRSESTTGPRRLLRTGSLQVRLNGLQAAGPRFADCLHHGIPDVAGLLRRRHAGRYAGPERAHAYSASGPGYAMQEQRPCKQAHGCTASRARDARPVSSTRRSSRSAAAATAPPICP